MSSSVGMVRLSTEEKPCISTLSHCNDRRCDGKTGLIDTQYHEVVTKSSVRRDVREVETMNSRINLLHNKVLVNKRRRTIKV